VVAFKTNANKGRRTATSMVAHQLDLILSGSPVDQSPNALARAVDTLSDETPPPQNMMENVAVCVALLHCPQPSGVLPVGSIRRSISPTEARKATYVSIVGVNPLAAVCRGHGGEGREHARLRMG